MLKDKTNVKVHYIKKLSVLLSIEIICNLVRERGLEPPRPCEHYHLKVACLPISALAHK